MGRKNRPNKKERQARREQYLEEDDQKGFEALSGRCEPEWWNRMDSHQLNYDALIQYYRFVTVDAKAGTGKTTIAVKNALDAIKSGKADIIRYVRFVDRRAQKLGFMPGNDKEKEFGYMYPFFEALEECGIRPEEALKLIASRVIEVSTDIHMRGRNMKRTFLIVDECQNGGIEDMRVVFTRVHDTAKTVAIGHSKQVDNNLPRIAGYLPFQVYQIHMLKKPWAKKCELVHNYRGDVSQWADEIDVTIEELKSAEKVYTSEGVK